MRELRNNTCKSPSKVPRIVSNSCCFKWACIAEIDTCYCNSTHAKSKMANQMFKTRSLRKQFGSIMYLLCATK